MATTVTPERMLELMEIYKALKERVNAIDAKYKLDYVEPKVDLPESLNLEKMTFKPKTEAELNLLAEQYVAPTVLSKQRSLDSSYATKLKSLGRKRTELSRELSDKLKKIDEDYKKAAEDVELKLASNGLIYSTTANTYRKAAYDDSNARKSDCNSSYAEDVKALDAEERDLEEVYGASCEMLAEEKQALIDKRYQALVDIEEKERAKVDKYNNGVDEKEQRYKYTRAKFIETMRRAERDRVLTMTKLYLELGDVTYRDRMIREKYAACQDYFWPLRRNEAHLLMDFDSFLPLHLENYYSAFVDWVDTMLLPPNN